MILHYYLFSVYAASTLALHRLDLSTYWSWIKLYFNLSVDGLGYTFSNLVIFSIPILISSWWLERPISINTSRSMTALPHSLLGYLFVVLSFGIAFSLSLSLFLGCATSLTFSICLSCDYPVMFNTYSSLFFLSAPHTLTYSAVQIKGKRSRSHIVVLYLLILVLL